MNRLFQAVAVALPLLVSCAKAQAPAPAATLPEPMTPAAVRMRLEAYAHDSMRGRATGTEDNLRATQWLADELRKAGLEPAGENGSYFQNVPLAEMQLDAPVSAITVAGRTLQPYTDYLPRNQGSNARAFDGVPVVYVGVWGQPGMLAGEQVKDRVALVATDAANYSVIKLQAQAAFAQAKAIVIANFELMPPQLRELMAAGSLSLDTPTTGEAPALMSYMHISRATAAQMLGVADLSQATIGQTGTPIGGRIVFHKVTKPARNVVAVLRGSDPTLRNEFVAVGAHNDHVGTGAPQDKDSTRAFNLQLRAAQIANNGQLTQQIVSSIRVNMDSIRRVHPTPRLDSIYNGADDDGSGSVAVLEVARAMAAAPEGPKRSVLFVWHTGEELGLFGSEYFTDHPTVTREQIVAQINMDMVGRGKAGDEKDGGPNYLQLVGSRRLSTQFGNLVEQVSHEKNYHWAFDYSLDVNGHPEQIYCRSDHYNYARYGIPVVFMTTGLHADYHEMTDEVEYIDFDKLSKVTRFAFDLATAVSNAPARPVLDKPKPNPNAPCAQ